jgi:branched-chain amino acid transport system ATP-binding protein
MGGEARSMETPELEVAGLQVAYGDLVAVWDVSLELHGGRIAVVVGRNGAGKTTLVHGICGLLPVTAGRVTLSGRDVTGVPPSERAAHGLSVVQEGKRVFRELTVRENLVLGLRAAKVARRDSTAGLDELFERFPLLTNLRDSRAGALSGGQQQMLAIATALACRPRVLLVDEPSSGLAPILVDHVFEVLASLRDEGLAILLVEQLVEDVLGGVAEDVIVLERGRVTMRDVAANVSPEVVARSIYAST